MEKSIEGKGAPETLRFLRSFHDYKGFTPQDIYKITTLSDFAKEPLENCIQEHFSGKSVLDVRVDNVDAFKRLFFD